MRGIVAAGRLPVRLVRDEGEVSRLHFACDVLIAKEFYGPRFELSRRNRFQTPLKETLINSPQFTYAKRGVIYSYGVEFGIPIWLVDTKQAVNGVCHGLVGQGDAFEKCAGGGKVVSSFVSGRAGGWRLSLKEVTVVFGGNRFKDVA